MQLIAPDILDEARGLSIPFSALGMLLGALLWTFGWRWHRFWVVLATTVTAGLIGLSGHAVIGPRMLAAGLLLAIAAGMMAIDLSRLLAFGAAGFACWLIVHKVLPHFQEPAICFLGGGVLGLLLYRLQLMFLSSLAAALLFGHSLLLLIEKLTELRFSAGDWSRANPLGLNIGVIVLTVGGIVVQGQLERWREGAGNRRRAWLMTFLTEAEREHLQQAPQKRGLLALFK
jgi:hypothetical protein